MSKTSFTFRFLKILGLNFSEEQYGEISFFQASKRGIKGIVNALILRYCMHSVLLSPLNYRYIRPKLWEANGG